MPITLVTFVTLMVYCLITGVIPANANAVVTMWATSVITKVCIALIATDAVVVLVARSVLRTDWPTCPAVVFVTTKAAVFTRCTTIAVVVFVALRRKPRVCCAAAVAVVVFVAETAC